MRRLVHGGESALSNVLRSKNVRVLNRAALGGALERVVPEVRVRLVVGVQDALVAVAERDLEPKLLLLAAHRRRAAARRHRPLNLLPLLHERAPVRDGPRGRRVIVNRWHRLARRDRPRRRLCAAARVRVEVAWLVRSVDRSLAVHRNPRRARVAPVHRERLLVVDDRRHAVHATCRRLCGRRLCAVLVLIRTRPVLARAARAPHLRVRTVHLEGVVVRSDRRLSLEALRLLVRVKVDKRVAQKVRAHRLDVRRRRKLVQVVVLEHKVAALLQMERVMARARHVALDGVVAHHVGPRRVLVRVRAVPGKRARALHHLVRVLRKVVVLKHRVEHVGVLVNPRLKLDVRQLAAVVRVARLERVVRHNLRGRHDLVGRDNPRGNNVRIR
eukprot:Opistho-1_new@71989